MNEVSEILNVLLHGNEKHLIMYILSYLQGECENCSRIFYVNDQNCITCNHCETFFCDNCFDDEFIHCDECNKHFCSVCAYDFEPECDCYSE